MTHRYHGREGHASASLLLLVALLVLSSSPLSAQKTKTRNPAAAAAAAAGAEGGSSAAGAANEAPVAPASQPSISVPDQRSYRFVAEQKAVLPGTSPEKADDGGAGTILATDRIGDLALVSLYYQNSCYVDGRYNSNDFPVERGYVTDAEGATRYPAFKVSPPRRKAAEWLASQHALSYRFPTAEAYTVYRLEQGMVSPVVRLSARDIKARGDTLLRQITVSELAADVTYVFVPDSKGMSAFTTLAPGVQAARVATTDAFSVYQFNYAVQAGLFDTRTGFPYGPASHENCYSYRRQYHGVTDASGAPGVVWQDEETLAVWVTWLGVDLKSPRTVALANDRKEQLGAACSAPDGTLYYLTQQAGDGAQGDRSMAMSVYKAGADGRTKGSGKLDTSASALNAVSFGDYVTSMAYTGGKLGVICGRSMHRSPDGLNHQGSIAFVLDADSLALITSHGQTSGHSFDSILLAEADGWFGGIDLGDNYPRGIHLHRFNGAGKSSAVVYTFKTEHGSTAANSAGTTFPRYAAISGGGKTFYSWSNDNRTYTELGGLVRGAAGYTIVFSGEASPDGRSLDSSRTGDYLVDPRNLGVVLASGDFWDVASAADTLIPPGLLLTSGRADKGGFYTFNGTWSPQNTYGVVWLTSYQDKNKENASRIKTAALPDGTILVLWEKWTPTAYVSTYMVRIDAYGRKLGETSELGPAVRLGRREDPIVCGSRVYLFGGDKVSSCLQLVAIEPKP